MLVFYLFIYIEIPLEPLLDNMEEKIKKTLIKFSLLLQIDTK